MRGEHTKDEETVIDAEGSSPHTRGARGRCCGEHAKCRVTPAYAGSTGPADVTHVLYEGHPRIRGEHRRMADA